MSSVLLYCLTTITVISLGNWGTLFTINSFKINYTDGEIVSDIQVIFGSNYDQITIKKLDAAPNNTIIDGKTYYILCNVKKRKVTDDLTRKEKDLNFVVQQISPSEWINGIFTLNKFDVLDKNYKVFEKTSTTSIDNYETNMNLWGL